MSKLVLEMLTSIGAVAAAASVFWAIFTYIRAEEQRSFSRVREELSSLKEYISQLDGLMSEPEFSMVGHHISKRIMALKPEEWSLDQFTEFLENKDNHDQIAQAIHIGRLDCNFVERIEDTVSKIRKSPTYLKEKLPILSAALSKVLFYVIKPGETVLSPVVFDRVLGDPDAVKGSLRKELEKHKHIQHYQTEIALFASAVPAMLMSSDSFGQKTFDLSERICHILIESFSRLSDSQLRENSSLQTGRYEKILKINNKHAIEDAVEILQLIKDVFDEKEWDTIVEYKGKIVQLMER